MLKYVLTALGAAVATSAGWYAGMENAVVAKQRDMRIMETTYAKRLHDVQRAYDDVDMLLHICRSEARSACVIGENDPPRRPYDGRNRRLNKNSIVMDEAGRTERVDRAPGGDEGE